MASKVFEVFALASFTARHQACDGEEHTDLFRVELRARGTVGADGTAVRFEVLRSEAEAIKARWEMRRVEIPGGNETAERVASYLLDDVKARVPSLVSVTWWDGMCGVTVIE